VTVGSIFLVGPMGAGKSAVGRALARSIRLEFADSDDEIERRTGVDIPFIFEKEGEAGFRKREAAVIDELTARGGLVLATGGGVVGDVVNRHALAARGTVIYLHASVQQQLERTRHGRDRPMLATGDPEAVLSRLFEERDPLYREIADLTVETDGRRVHQVVEEIRRRL
jgi:shikimate kinase